MSYQAVEAVMKRSRTAGSDRLLLMVIATHADAETMTAYLGETTLCKEANMKERNLRYTLAKLKASGELECVIGGGRGRANLYRLTLPVQSDKGAEDCPVSNNQLEPEKGQRIAPLSDQRGQSVAGFSDGKRGNPSPEKGQPIAEKGQSAAPQPLEPEGTVNTHTPRARVARGSVCVSSQFSLEERKAHATRNGLGDGWLTLSGDGRYDEMISDQLTPTANLPTAKPAQLPPEQADSLISKAAAMLKDGADISEVDKQFSQSCPRSQWATIRSAAQAQAKVTSKPTESPPPRAAANVVSMNSRAQR